MQWKILTPATVYPVSVKQALDQARIDDIESNRSWIVDAIADATGHAETETQLSLITRTIEATYWPDRSDAPPESNPFPPYTCLPIFRGPIQTIISVTDRYGNPASYQTRKVGMVDFVQLAGSTIGPVTITYTAGYGDTADKVPADIRRAIVAHVVHMYRYRECDEDSIPKGLDFIYSKYRSGSIG